MKVKRLSMNGFRGFDQLTLDFNPELPTVIIGNNGVGKTSILDCIAIHLIAVWNPIEERPNSQDSDPFNVRILMPSYHQDKLIAIPIKDSFNQLDINTKVSEIQTKLIISIEGVEGDCPISIDFGHYEQQGIRSDLLKIVKDIKDNCKKDSQVNIPLAVYFPVSRAVLDIQIGMREPSVFRQIAAYNEALTGVKLGFDSFFQWFKELEDFENEKIRDNRTYIDLRLEAIRTAISLLIPEFSKLRVRRSPLRMTVEKEGEELTINQLSDGEKCLLAMVGDLARRLAIANPSLPDPLQGQGVVLIDEIELHLHPKWQREIIPALTRTFPNCQFIVTTHSPQVLSQVKPEGIYILEKTDEGIVAKRPESSYGRDSNRILEDLMDVPERPQDIKDRLLELFRLIDKGDIESARQIRQQLALEIGEGEPEFVSADVLIRRKEILNR